MTRCRTGRDYGDMATKSQPGALAALVESARERGLSPETMSRQARKAGHRISRQQIYEYANGTVKKAPDRAGIAALAAALDVSRERVLLAVLDEWWDYVPDVVASDDRLAGLTEDEEAEVMRYAEYLRASRNAQRHGEPRAGARGRRRTAPPSDGPRRGS